MALGVSVLVGGCWEWGKNVENATAGEAVAKVKVEVGGDGLTLGVFVDTDRLTVGGDVMIVVVYVGDDE